MPARSTRVQNQIVNCIDKERFFFFFHFIQVFQNCPQNFTVHNKICYTE
jgi:hypothetical protein